MDVYEIECVLTDEYGLISQVGVKGYGMQSVSLISHLIKEHIVCFFTFRNKTRIGYLRTLQLTKFHFLPLILMKQMSMTWTFYRKSVRHC